MQDTYAQLSVAITFCIRRTVLEWRGRFNHQNLERSWKAADLSAQAVRNHLGCKLYSIESQPHRLPQRADILYQVGTTQKPKQSNESARIAINQPSVWGDRHEGLPSWGKTQKSNQTSQAGQTDVSLQQFPEAIQSWGASEHQWNETHLILCAYLGKTSIKFIPSQKWLLAKATKTASVPHLLNRRV